MGEINRWGDAMNTEDWVNRLASIPEWVARAVGGRSDAALHQTPEDGDWSVPPTYRSTGHLVARRETTADALREPWGVRRQPGGSIISSYLDPAGMHGLLSALHDAPELWAFDNLPMIEALNVPHVNHDAEAFAIQRERVADHWRQIEALIGHVVSGVSEIARDAEQRARLDDWQRQQGA